MDDDELFHRRPTDPAGIRRIGRSGWADMSIHALLLDGWEHTSIWGVDDHLYYAQLTPNGVSDDSGPQIWIGPPQHRIGGATELLRAIAGAIGEPVETVDEAMSRGMAMSRGERVKPVLLGIRGVEEGRR